MATRAETERMLDSMDKLKDGQTVIREAQIKQAGNIEGIEKDLGEHMKRTELSEQRIKMLEDKNIERSQRTVWKWLKTDGKTILTVAGIIATLFAGLEWIIQYVMSTGNAG